LIQASRVLGLWWSNYLLRGTLAGMTGRNLTKKRTDEIRSELINLNL
jgi:hypothetical protein